MKYQNRLIHKFIAGSAAVAIASLALPLLAQQSGQPTTPPKTEHHERAPHNAASFIKKAAEGNMAEVQLGQLADQKSQNDQVKKFAQRMVQDHGQANQNLQAIAQQQKVTWPTKLYRKERREDSRLQKLNGSEFDKAYAEAMIRDHAKDVREYEAAANDIQDAALKDYVQKTLPTIRDHLKMAEQMGQAVGLPQNTISSLEQGRHHAMGAPSTSSGQQSGSSY